MRIVTLFPLLALVLVPTIAGAQSFGGIGVRAEGMGGAFVAVADDASAVFWNPAGLATGATFDAQLSGGSRSQWLVGLAAPVLGFSVYRTDTDFARPDRQEVGSGGVPQAALTATHVGVTVVQTVVNGLVIGATTRLVRGGVEGEASKTTGDLDVGGMLTVGMIRVGLTGRNLRAPAFETGTGEIRARRLVRGGIALAPRALPSGVHGPFTVAFDVDMGRVDEAAGEQRQAAAGGEYWLFGGRIGVRGGLRWVVRDGDALARVSGGGTVRLPRGFHLDGQMTEGSGDDKNQWNLGLRVTF